ncbi:RAD52 motif-containing protein 1 isoform X2 [Toxotes jaculatrix]|uniref:RAD52 motif-containing protein 1 isoform X2 n=1 Tax=Toxotes jaculatrix TaxID=941984 RepID=UPI001B3AF45E|nr:RAD52 motif-containing protein 1 isoform X2 [Toxotes jaculatrix]
MDGEVEVDILEFVVPVENNKSLFVWDIQPSLTEAQIYDRLFGVFSSFGPLYLLKVRLSSKDTPHFLCNDRPLSHARCLELANHCLGFNGWTSDIITLKELTNEEEEEGDEDEEGGGGRRRRLRFGCLLQLSFPHHGQSTRGTAVVEDSFTCTGPDVLLQKRCKLQKLVREKALVQAFTTVLLILPGNGKVMVEVKQTSDQGLPEQTEEVVQVNEFSWSEFAPDEEEGEDEEWDLTVS